MRALFLLLSYIVLTEQITGAISDRRLIQKTMLNTVYVTSAGRTSLIEFQSLKLEVSLHFETNISFLCDVIITCGGNVSTV
jgi:hypothetical protein